jgi:hypothetical protein
MKGEKKSIALILVFVALSALFWFLAAANLYAPTGETLGWGIASMVMAIIMTVILVIIIWGYLTFKLMHRLGGLPHKKR